MDMEKLIKSIGVVGIIILVIGLLCLAPMIFLWSVNWLAEMGGASFYIPHTPWSYLISIIFIGMVRGK
jgi:hypothetical protein